MAKLATANQRLVTGVTNPLSGYSRVFGLSCKVLAGVGVMDFAYCPPLGKNFWLKFMSIHYCGGAVADPCGGTIYISAGTGIPVAATIVAQWEIIVPFWAGTTKPAIMVQGVDQYLWWPMNRLYTREALRFGLCIENFSDTRVFWVDVWFEISEG